MTTKLYIANLSRDATEHGLRAHFSTCGGVLDVEILTDRRSGRPLGTAWVTMTSTSFAAAAVERLDGVPFEGQPLRVSDTPIRNQPAGPKVKIVQQFRERNNMTYDLDCAGAPLTIRMFPTEDDGWRIEARTNDVDDAVVAKASARTRGDALAEIARWWQAEGATRGLPALDWAAITTALVDVRAV